MRIKFNNLSPAWQSLYKLKSYDLLNSVYKFSGCEQEVKDLQKNRKRSLYHVYYNVKIAITCFSKLNIELEDNYYTFDVCQLVNLLWSACKIQHKIRYNSPLNVLIHFTTLNGEIITENVYEDVCYVGTANLQDLYINIADWMYGWLKSIVLTIVSYDKNVEEQLTHNKARILNYTCAYIENTRQ